MLSNQRTELLKFARQSIQYGLDHGHVMPVKLDALPKHFKNQQATFVTLEMNDELRGCIGCLDACRPLVEDIIVNAYKAAFEDPRFKPLKTNEWPEVKLSLSLLQPPTAMYFDSELDLIQQIRPHIDGLILQDGFHKGTFLPSVWNSLPESKQFLQHLKQKAGIPVDYWSDSIQVYRYTVEYITET